MGRRPLVPEALRRGPFTVAEAARHGISARRLSGPAWRRVGPGRFQWAGLPVTPATRLAEAWSRLPRGAAFSGLTAAFLHGLDVDPCNPIEVTVPEAVGVSARSGMVVSRQLLEPGDLVRRQRYLATSPLRTVTDLGRRLPLVEAVVVLDQALHKGLVQLEALHGFVALAGGRRGVARVKQALELVEPLAESPMETRLRVLLVRAGLPRPVAQVSLTDRFGNFLGRPDLLYPDERLILEYDGGIHRESLAADNRRQNRLQNAGYRLLRFTGADVLGSPEAVVLQVRLALAQGSSAGARTLFLADSVRPPALGALGGSRSGR